MKAILLLTLCIAVVSIALCIAFESSDDWDFLPAESSRHRTRYRRCNSKSDCRADQCCIQQHPKKDGFCRPLGREGQYCSEFHMCARTASDKVCPCRGSLVCEPGLPKQGPQNVRFEILLQRKGPTNQNPRASFPRNTCQVKKT